MKSNIIFMSLILLTMVVSCKPGSKLDHGNSVILTNHLGYNTNGFKRAVVQSDINLESVPFTVKNLEDEVIFIGVLKRGGTIDEWHTGKAYELDFTEIDIEGSFYITIVSDETELNSDIFKVQDQVLAKNNLALLVQGINSQRAAGEYNKRDKKMSFFGERSDTVDVSGGWYDASGDRGKYLSHLSYANFFNPQQAPMVVWNFYETLANIDRYQGTDKEDVRKALIEEATYGADYLVRVQDPEGYFYMNIFANWSWDPNRREISSYVGQEGIKNDRYQSGFREGGGISIAALARAAREGFRGEFTTDQYLRAAILGFDHLIEHNSSYIEDGIENIIDDYCALLAAVELYKATERSKYLEHARFRANNLISRLSNDEYYSGFWTADINKERPYYHAAEAGLPLVSLIKFLDIENDPVIKSNVIDAIRTSVRFELTITGDVHNPFGYARQYVKATNEPKPRAAFFMPHVNETSYWWQGENARLGSLAVAMNLAKPYLNGPEQYMALEYSTNLINWIFGLNPFDMTMVQGSGRNNPNYSEQGSELNVNGCVSNGITAGFYNQNDIAFAPMPYGNDPYHSWRWGEQWLQHGSWLLLALTSGFE